MDEEPPSPAPNLQDQSEKPLTSRQMFSSSLHLGATMSAAGYKGHAGGSVGSRDPERSSEMAGRKASPLAGRGHVNGEMVWQGVAMEAAEHLDLPEPRNMRRRKKASSVKWGQYEVDSIFFYEKPNNK